VYEPRFPGELVCGAAVASQQASAKGMNMEDSLQRTSLDVFSIRGTPLLASGSTMEMVTRAPGLWMHVKVYADGGENGLHSHPKVGRRWSAPMRA